MCVVCFAGTYTGAGNNGLTFGAPQLHIASLAGAADTVIDMQGSGRAFSFTGAQTSSTTITGALSVVMSLAIYIMSNDCLLSFRKRVQEKLIVRIVKFIQGAELETGAATVPSISIESELKERGFPCRPDNSRRLCVLWRRRGCYAHDRRCRPYHQLCHLQQQHGESLLRPNLGFYNLFFSSSTENVPPFRTVNSDIFIEDYKSSVPH